MKKDHNDIISDDDIKQLTWLIAKFVIIVIFTALYHVFYSPPSYAIPIFVALSFIILTQLEWTKDVADISPGEGRLISALHSSRPSKKVEAKK